MWGGEGRGIEGPTSKGREGIGGKGRGKGEEGRGRESGRGERSASRGGLTPLFQSHCIITIISKTARLRDKVTITLIGNHMPIEWHHFQ